MQKIVFLEEKGLFQSKFQIFKAPAPLEDIVRFQKIFTWLLSNPIHNFSAPKPHRFRKFVQKCIFGPPYCTVLLLMRLRQCNMISYLILIHKFGTLKKSNTKGRFHNHALNAIPDFSFDGYFKTGRLLANIIHITFFHKT